MIIGLDVGGTHTDVVLLDNAGLLREAKVTTDASDLFHSVLKGLDAVTEGVDAAAIRRIVLSTTLTTNAVIQNTIPAVGMIVSAGPGIDPEHFRTNPHYVCVKGSIDHRGREVEPIRPEEIQAAAEHFRENGIRQVGVVGKFSVRNPAHEIRIGELLGDSFDKVFLGHRVSGSLNFGRRIATTYLNAAVYPIHKSFFDAVTNSLSAKGMHLPLRLLKADGGNMKLEASVEFPAQTILSGPAASVMGAVAMAARDEDAIVMDIGGTTTDLAVLIGRAPVLDPHGIAIGSYQTLIRSLETLSIGMGGDSAVRFQNGRLSVGPDRKGPAMLFGGSVPTPTDALAVMGDMTHDDCGPACAGLKSMAAQMGISVETLANEVIETACRAMLAAAERLTAHINGKPVYTLHDFKEGYRVQPRSVLVLGGPAPYFARHLQRLTPMQVRVVPRWQVANAIGAALARTTCEVGLFADTEQRVVNAPAENFLQAITDGYDLEAATAQALDLLRVKALERGANPDYLEMEVVETQQFNMVRGFTTSGRNLRVRVQVRPGLIHGYDNLLKSLAARSEQSA
ncbi:MAG: hydantoinase/oxoprolinase family protein [Desulfobacterales bacterium]|jgi:N-methylhydantoinase A/oxoprolinase/acetone carboxylase beta subunit|nr:hydantoinase/oxoprolinase family protein [Desulfobacterales bacterium]